MITDRMSFFTSNDETANLPRDEFLRRLPWRKNADARLKQAAQAGDPEEFGRALDRRLRAAKGSRISRPATPTLLQPLWSRHAFGAAVDTGPGATFLRELHETLTSGKSSAKINVRLSRRVEEELAAVPETASSPWLALQWLAVLSEVGKSLPPHVLCDVWRATWQSSQSIAAGAIGEDSPDDLRMLAGGELPWRIGLCFDDLRGSGRLRKSGAKCLRDGLDALTDGDGTPHAAALHRFPLLLAVFTRSMNAGAAAGERLWDAGSGQRFQSLLNRAAALCGADGTIALSNGATFAPASLLRTASCLAGRAKRAPAACRLRSLPDDLQTSRSSNKSAKTPANRTGRPPSFDEGESPSSQSDWAELACLRNNWLTGADSCVVTHHLSRPQISLTAFERLLISGEWAAEVLVDGEPVALDQDWSCVCWFSDEDADYLELQLDADGVALSRQVMLSRTDHWLFIADAATAPQAETIEVSTRLPLAAGVRAEPSRWTREITLTQQKLKAAAYPLGLEEQRVTHAHGSFDGQTGELVLRQRQAGTALYAPLVIDWSPARKRDQSQWRRLTVAEDGVILRPDAAAGYRLRVGKSQWLFYRSLRAGETARTVLGHHTPHETVIAEFTSGGTVEPLVMVE